MRPRSPLPQTLTHAPFATADVDAHGRSRSRLRGRDVAHPFHGVNAVAADLSTIAGLCDAYAHRMRDGQFFSHLTAALLFGVPLPRDTRPMPLHVSVISPRTPPRTRGVIGHRVASDDVLVGEFEGRSLCSPADVWCQVAAELSKEDLVAAGDFLVSGCPGDDGRTPPLATIEQLKAAAARYSGKRGSGKITWALERIRTKVDSRPESLLRLLLVAVGLPEALIADPTEVDGGRLTLRADLKYPEWRIVFEYEGDGHRTDKKRWRGDIARRELFETAGWRVIRVTADDLFLHPMEFIARVRRAIAARVRAGYGA